LIHPPRLARRLLRRFVPTDVRDSVDGDLAELYAQRAASHGRMSAAASYWRETMSFGARFFVEGLPRAPMVPRSLREAFSSVDVRLSGRLLIKNPGLTFTSSVGIAAAIGITTGFLAFYTALVHPRLPLDEGERIVALENWDVAVNNEHRRSARDFLTWRDEMRTVVDVSAFRSITASIETAPATAEEITVAAMTASGFRVARVPALLGRYLTPDDEHRGGSAPLVLVIGYDVWRTRFGGDSSILGRKVQINETAFTIVGVMPPGFGFPVNHQYWTTLLMDPLRMERGNGPVLFVFGRLARGATLQSANAELSAIGRRSAAEFPQTNGTLRPQVMAYTVPLMDIQDMKNSFFWLFQVAISLIVLVVGLNVAILVYARTAVRRSEIAVRTALGATRSRIVGQLFVEALALSLPSAMIGLALAQYGLRLGSRLADQDSSLLAGRPPFWADYGVRPLTALYALGLALLVAVLVGVLPALQATGRHIEADLRQLGGTSGIRLGKRWTALVIAQVAFAVAILPPALTNGLRAAQDAFTRPTYPVAEFTTGWLGVRRTNVPAGESTPPLGARIGDVVRALRSNPSVVGVSFDGDAPIGGGWTGRVEVEGLETAADANRRLRSRAVDTSYLDLYGARLLAGRHFQTADLADSARVVIVSRSFVHRMLGERPPLGRRIRYAQRIGANAVAGAAPAAQPPWFEIVGVVDDLQHNAVDAEVIAPRIYHPLAPERRPGAWMTVRARGTAPSTFATTVHETIAAVSPDLRLGTMRAGDAVAAESRTALQLVGTILLLILATVVLLAAAGVYALMSVTVDQRRREIAVRAALGASQRQVISKVFGRAVRQIGWGVAVGAVAAALIVSATGSATTAQAIIVIPVVALIMVVVGLGAAYVPTRRGLAVQPAEALRS
jgi:putative ABC transport system permease protein